LGSGLQWVSVWLSPWEWALAFELESQSASAWLLELPSVWPSESELV
jgi:hypothetical protein